MKVSLIVAMDRRGVIGANGGLPWHLPADLKNFKRITLGKPIVMGRKTHESIGRVLPGRENIILTRDSRYPAPGCTLLHSVNAVLEHCRGVAEIMIMGGADLYAQFLPRADRIYLTEIDAEFAGDKRFPDWSKLHGPEWHEVQRERPAADAGNSLSFSFVVLERLPAQRAPTAPCA